MFGGKHVFHILLFWMVANSGRETERKHKELRKRRRENMRTCCKPDSLNDKGTGHVYICVQDRRCVFTWLYTCVSVCGCICACSLRQRAWLTHLDLLPHYHACLRVCVCLTYGVSNTNNFLFPKWQIINVCSAHFPLTSAFVCQITL